MNFLQTFDIALVVFLHSSASDKSLWSVRMPMSIYTAHYHTVHLMRSVDRVLLKKLGQATKAGDVEVWIMQIIAQRFPGISELLRTVSYD